PAHELDQRHRGPSPDRAGRSNANRVDGSQAAAILHRAGFSSDGTCRSSCHRAELSSTDGNSSGSTPDCQSFTARAGYAELAVTHGAGLATRIHSIPSRPVDQRTMAANQDSGATVSASAWTKLRAASGALCNTAPMARRRAVSNRSVL